MPERRRLLIVDGEASKITMFPTKANTEKLPDEFGKNLDTVSKAYQWLTNPHNWHDGNMFILRWDGLLCTINRTFAHHLLNGTDGQGIPEVVVREQMRLRRGGRQERELPEEG